MRNEAARNGAGVGWFKGPRTLPLVLALLSDKRLTDGCDVSRVLAVCVKTMKEMMDVPENTPVYPESGEFWFGTRADKRGNSGDTRSPDKTVGSTNAYRRAVKLTRSSCDTKH